MWHHPTTVKARLRRWSGVVFRPVAIAFDPRLDGLEHRIVERIEARLGAVESNVATDAEVTAEMTITQSRLLARLEARLAAIEERVGRGSGAAPLVAAWVIGALAGLRVPARVGVWAPGDASLAVALAGLGHSVVVIDAAAAVPSHPRIRRDDGGAAELDAAVLLGGEAGLDVALVARAAARLRSGGMVLLSAPQRQAGELDEAAAELRVEEKVVAAPAASGVWEVARDGAPGGDGVALLRAAAVR